jgi:hypothetical protein
VTNFPVPSISTAPFGHGDRLADRHDLAVGEDDARLAAIPLPPP